MSKDDVSNRQILDAIHKLAAKFEGLSTRVGDLEVKVGSMDERLLNVEYSLIDIKGKTNLIPGMAEAITNYAGEFDSIDKRLKTLEGAMA